MPKLGTAPNTTTKGLQLYPYQEAGVEFLRSRSRAYLGDEMGLGKTAQLIRASEGRTLVVAPAMLVDTGTWEGEVARWSDDPSRFTITAYSRLNHRSGRKAAPFLRDEFKRDWDTVIFDEAHYLKSRDSIRTKVSLQLSKRAERVYLASGTPVPNWAHELFVPLQILRPEDARAGMELGSYWRWVETWFRTSRSPFSQHSLEIGRLRGCTSGCARRSPDDPCEHFAVFSQANLRNQMLRRLRDDVLQDLLELDHQVVQIPMTATQWREYRSMKRSYIAEVDDQEIIAWSSAAKHTNLDRMTTSLGMLNGDPLKHSGKFDRLAADLSERTRPTVVVAHYRDSVLGAQEVARSLGLTTEVIYGGTTRDERERVVKQFQQGNIQVLVGSFDTISEGLTLTAADTIILLELSYKAARNQQVVRRIHRIGQERSCLVLEYQATGPAGQKCLDTNKRALIDKKISNSSHALTASTLKEIL